MSEWPHPDDVPFSRGEKVLGVVLVALSVYGIAAEIWYWVG